jgi:hypothetical protein
MQRSEARDLFPVGALAQTQTERCRRLALATGFGFQAVWNRSNRRAGERRGRGLRVKRGCSSEGTLLTNWTNWNTERRNLKEAETYAEASKTR